MMRTRIAAIGVVVAVVCSWPSLQAWGGQGHRLVGLVAAKHLSRTAAQNVNWLLDGQSLADVSNWADAQITDLQQTATWHYLNIPPTAAGYDRDRDCQRQPGVAAGSRGDTWRDCIVDRITYFEQRTADTKLDRADRATALKYLVHSIGDLHQPFHALGVGRGGNDVIVRVFGNSNCGPSTPLGTGPSWSRAGNDPKRPPLPCNLHSVWDSRLIARRDLSGRAYAAALESLIKQKGWFQQPVGTPKDWAEQSWALGKTALVPTDTNIDEAYYQKHIGVIDERLALAGVRLAAVLNRVFIK
ncbi:MAG: S1/P1 nuclease [Acidobacteriota bacterium]|nr:S1/P1 nuclease [Acidobacteriota bacterium]